MSHSVDVGGRYEHHGMAGVGVPACDLRMKFIEELYIIRRSPVLVLSAGMRFHV